MAKKYNNKNESKGENIRKGSNGSNRSGANHSNAKDKSTRNGRKDDRSRFRNDPNYYYTDPTLIDQLASFSFDEFVGVPVNLDNHIYDDSNIDLAGWLKIKLRPSAGLCRPLSPRESGINVAGFQLYTRLSSINAKTTQYQPNDLSMLILALGNILAYVGYLRRCFGVAFLVNQRNRLVPRELLEDLVGDADDFVKNLAAYRIRFNYILSTLQRIPFPTNISYFAKCSTLFSNLYLDGTTGMSQMYVPTIASVWIFDEQSDPNGTILRDVNLDLDSVYTDINNFSDMLDLLESMTEQLVNSSTLNYVYADILNLAAKENIPLYTMELQPEVYPIVPIYNENMLVMFNNLTIAGEVIEDPEVWTEAENAGYTVPDWLTDNSDYFTLGNNVYSDPGRNAITYAPAFKTRLGVAAGDILLNYPVENPSVDVRVESTRMTHAALGDPSVEIDEDGQPSSNILNVFYHDVALPDWYCSQIQVNGDLVPIKESGYTSATDAINALTQFDFHPRMYLVRNGKITSVMGDLNYCTTIDYTYLKKVHDAALLALFTLR